MKSYPFGVSYYPEHWDKDVRRGDPERFANANFNVVRMGEFAWSLIEPTEGHFDFSLFDETIETLAKKGIRTLFCTPTATPPRWLSEKHPDILRSDALGIPLEHGSRQHASHFSQTFRKYSRSITQALATHFASNPNIIGWQTDNEFHCHFSEDHSPAAQAAFREFLSLRYQNIDNLNTAWGTAFWSLTYQNFDQVLTPKFKRPAATNPAHALDYYRFLDWGVTLFQREQIDILRQANPNWPITHNGVFDHIDYHGPFGKDLDFLSYDLYPFFEHDPQKRGSFAAFNLDWTRAYAGNFYVMEQQSGPGGQLNYFHDNPEPGEIRKMAWASVAHGADGLLLFRERSCRFGAEEFWCGALDHDNIPRRRYQEVSQLGEELKKLGAEIIGSQVKVDIGIAGVDFTNDENHLPMPLGLPKPKTIARTLHRYFLENDFAVGIVHPDDISNELSTYFIPHYTYIDEAWLPKFRHYVENGGWLVIGARSGIKDKSNNIVAQTFPGILSQLAGVKVEEYGAQNNPHARPLTIKIGEQEVTTELWYESLKLSQDARPIAHWTSRHLKGEPAISHRQIKKGGVIYVGTYFTEAVLEKLIPHLKTLNAVKSPAFSGKPNQVEIAERESPAKHYRFYLNHSDQPQELDWPAALGTSQLGHTESNGKLQLPPYDVALFQRSL